MDDGVPISDLSSLKIHPRRSLNPSIYQSTFLLQPDSYTYSQLRAEVNRLANALKSGGVQKGDRVAIFMAHVPEVSRYLLEYHESPKVDRSVN